MKARLTLKPGRKGTKKLTEQYGERLVCVRYRYDEKRKKRLKTVGLIAEEIDWIPEFLKIKDNHPENRIVGIRIGFGEKDFPGIPRTPYLIPDIRYDIFVRKLGMVSPELHEGA